MSQAGNSVTFKISMVICLVLIATGVPVQFYNAIRLQGLKNGFGDPVCVFFFMLSLPVAIGSFSMAINSVFGVNLVTDPFYHLSAGVEQFILWQPAAKRQLSVLKTQTEQLAAQNTLLYQQNNLAHEELTHLRLELDSLTRSYKERITGDKTIRINPGFIYVMRRQSDGILKIGRTTDTDRRLSQHKKDYQTDFELVCRFVVPDTILFERLALEMTSQYLYKEEGRTELRKMEPVELGKFLNSFRHCCIEAITA